MRQRLVLLAFVGAAPVRFKTDAAHIDGNRANKRMGNLAWKSSIENAADKHRHGTTARGERIGKATQTQALLSAYAICTAPGVGR